MSAIPVRESYYRCTTAWACCPGWIRLLTLFVVGNIVGDVIAFPFVHSFWNLVGFEGWFHKEDQ